jgi:hypothetical protein
MATSNVDAVVASLKRFLDGYNFTRPGKDQSLGRDIVTTIALGIQERSVQDKASATDLWPANTAEVATRKAKDYGVIDQPNVETGQMLSLPSLKGTETAIEPDRITMKYGTGQVPTRTATNQGKVKANPKTDREKAHYAHTGQSSKGVIRKFYEADDKIAGDVREECRENLNGYIRDVNAATAAAAGAGGGGAP